jgi:hypothetical protein
MSKRFSASSAAQLMACPGSANLELALPGYVDPIRDEMAGAKGVGTNVHSALEINATQNVEFLLALQKLVEIYAELHWTVRRPIVEDNASCEEWVVAVWYLNQLGPLVPQTFDAIVEWFMLFIREAAFTPSMLRFIAEAMKYVRELREETNLDIDAVYGELQMQAGFLESKPGTTADIVIDSGDTLDVLDYKSGKIPVEVIDNDQLLFYAASAYIHLNSKAEYIRMHIVQPNNLVEWTISYVELGRWIMKAQEADAKITAKDLTLVPNDHCTYCPANPHTRGDKAKKLCPVMMEFLYPTYVNEQELFDV